MKDIAVGDEVLCYPQQLYAIVQDVFPAAVCVRLLILDANGTMRFVMSPQLWRAEDIENLSVCRVCGSRENLHLERGTGIPFRMCEGCLAAGVERPDQGRAAL